MIRGDSNDPKIFFQSPKSPYGYANLAHTLTNSDKEQCNINEIKKVLNKLLNSSSNDKSNLASERPS